MRHRRHLLTTAVAATTLLLGACGSDSPKSSSGATLPAGITIPGITIPGITIPNITLPAGITLPPASDGCAAARQQWALLFAAALNPAAAGQIDIATSLDQVKDAVPDELEGDVATLSQAYSGFVQVLSKYQGNVQAAMADPEALAALQALGTAEVQAASTRIQAFFDEQCPS